MGRRIRAVLRATPLLLALPSPLDHAPHRYYSPFQARWTTRDPLGMIDGPNVYAYVRGNPVRYVDPDGQLAVVEIVIAAGVVVTITLTLYGGYKVWKSMSEVSGRTHSHPLDLGDLEGLPPSLPKPPPLSHNRSYVEGITRPITLTEADRAAGEVIADPVSPPASGILDRIGDWFSERFCY